MLSGTLHSCNREYQKVAKSGDMEYKYQKAKEFYNNGDCIKAIPLFEELITYYKGNRDLEDLYYGYAYCHYVQKEFIVASYHFERFAQLYPRSPQVEDAAFMTAKCNHEQSPKYNLDQTPTLKAIAEYQRFTERFPYSGRIQEANAAIDELRLKLHKKAFANAMLYYKLKDYQAAAATFKALVEEYPESKDVERSYFYIVMSNKLFADNSYDTKKKERYEATVEAYEVFSNRFPASGYLKDLDKLYATVLEQLEKINNALLNNSDNERGS
jgi:outer membrane protein assembly factor BamD